MGRISALTEVTQLASDDYLVVLDSSANIAKKVTVGNALGIPDYGWTAAGETWTYASATTITVPSDATTKYNVGMVIKFDQTTDGTKHAVITDVASTTLTVKMLNGYDLDNETISTPFYSAAPFPVGTQGIIGEQLGRPIAFRATNCSGTSFINNSQTKATFSTEVYDYGGNYSSNKFTAPYDGVYSFFATVGDWTSSATRQFMSFYKNGTEYVRSIDGAARQSMLSCSIELSAGDYVECYVYQSSGANRTGSSNDYASLFSGYLVGRTDI